MAKDITLSSLKGTAVMVNFWALVRPLQIECHRLVELQDKYRKEGILRLSAWPWRFGSEGNRRVCPQMKGTTRVDWIRKSSPTDGGLEATNQLPL